LFALYQSWVAYDSNMGAVFLRLRVHSQLWRDMPIRRERRHRERKRCKVVFPFELMRAVDRGPLIWINGIGHAINRNIRGMLVLLPAPVNERQVFEIEVPSASGKPHSAKLVEVCWSRPIKVDARAKLYLAGTRFLFEVPAPI